MEDPSEGSVMSFVQRCLGPCAVGGPPNGAPCDGSAAGQTGGEGVGGGSGGWWGLVGAGG